MASALTPHVLHPMPRDGLQPERAVLRHAGLFNLGFIAVGPSAVAFLELVARAAGDGRQSSTSPRRCSPTSDGSTGCRSVVRPAVHARPGPERRLLEPARAAAHPRRRTRARRRQPAALLPLQRLRPRPAVDAVEARRRPTQGAVARHATARRALRRVRPAAGRCRLVGPRRLLRLGTVGRVACSWTPSCVAALRAGVLDAIAGVAALAGLRSILLQHTALCEWLDGPAPGLFRHCRSVVG